MGIKNLTQAIAYIERLMCVSDNLEERIIELEKEVKALKEKRTK